MMTSNDVRGVAPAMAVPMTCFVTVLFALSSWGSFTNTRFSYLGPILVVGLLMVGTGISARLLRVHGAEHPRLAAVARVWSEVVADLEPHLRREEQVLFPWIRRLASGAIVGPSVCAPIGQMMAEHQALGDLLRALRRAADDYRVPDGACASFRALYDGLAAFEADTHLHIHKEDDLLFRAAVALEVDR